MVGDSIYDFEGAMAVGVDFIGVLYGFGFHDRLEFPFTTVFHPIDLCALI